MENKPVRGIVRPYRHLPSGNYGVGSPQGLAHRPSNDLSLERVHDHRQVHPSLTGPYAGHVGYPYLVFPVYRKVTVQYIGRYRIIVSAVRGDPELSLSFGEKPVGPHYPGLPRS